MAKATSIGLTKESLTDLQKKAFREEFETWLVNTRLIGRPVLWRVVLDDVKELTESSEASPILPPPTPWDRRIAQRGDCQRDLAELDRARDRLVDARAIKTSPHYSRRFMILQW